MRNYYQEQALYRVGTSVYSTEYPNKKCRILRCTFRPEVSFSVSSDNDTYEYVLESPDGTPSKPIKEIMISMSKFNNVLVVKAKDVKPRMKLYANNNYIGECKSVEVRKKFLSKRKIELLVFRDSSFFSILLDPEDKLFYIKD